jgi:hypothetical protein
MEAEVSDGVAVAVSVEDMERVPVVNVFVHTVGIGNLINEAFPVQQ